VVRDDGNRTGLTLPFPVERLGEVNLAIEHGGAFPGEFYPTYDYKTVWQEQQRGQK
jgi:hypothetical protein